jgi:EAL domain-containing protein (putative c-di-GMP-specific phosphodiesterase class I)
MDAMRQPVLTELETEASRSRSGPGGPLQTIILTTSLVVLLFAWTAGVEFFLYRTEATILGLGLQLGGTVVVALVGASIGIRWGRERRSALAAAAGLEGDLALEAQVRAILRSALHMIPAGASLPQAGQAVCASLCTIPGVDMASVEVFIAPNDAELLAVTGPAEFGLVAGQHLPAAFSSRLYAGARRGPWGEYWKSAPEDKGVGTELDRVGLAAFAFAPIINGDHLVGGVGIGTADPTFSTTLAERFPLLVDFSSAPSALLGERIEQHLVEQAAKSELQGVIEQRAFLPVYQPIVELSSGKVVGYEALTRFFGGQPPDLAFAGAHKAGIGLELEQVTLEAAIAGAHDLPAGAWLDLNVSPGLLAQGSVLRACIAKTHRRLVLEVTEHEQVADYPALRRAVHDLGPGVRLAVDDAGAGIANFAHILELDADLVKLDMSLVRSINDSPGRQALVLAMGHFALTVGCKLVAEGVETEAEAAALADFGVEFGQGYWYGRPEPAPRNPVQEN